MNHEDDLGHVSRRAFVKAGLATAAIAGLPSVVRAGPGDQESKAEKTPLPRRALGRGGEKVTILTFGTGPKPTTRMLNAMYDVGIRYVDTADCYAGGLSEKTVGKWMAKRGNRKDLFIVTKDHPHDPDEWVRMLDKRLEALQTDYVDLFFLHGLGGGFNPREKEDSKRDWPKLKEWGQAAEKMKKSGKLRFAGFSTHCGMKLRTELLNNAAKGGWVDAIMVAQDPQVVREDAAFNKALDACHKAGIGLVSMKQMRGVGQVEKSLPQFKEMGLTPHQAVLHAVWTDERFASICSEMANIRILKENAEAARGYKPMDEKKTAAVIDLYRREGRRYCNACDGRCREAAGTKAALGDIARYLSYYELDGNRAAAKQGFAALTPEERDWAGADLGAAKAACLAHLDFAALLPRAEQKLA